MKVMTKEDLYKIWREAFQKGMDAKIDSTYAVCISTRCEDSFEGYYNKIYLEEGRIKEYFAKANDTTKSDARPFDDLIKEIEFEGEKFIPAQRIAALCFNYKEETVLNDYKMWVNNSHDYFMWYKFDSKHILPKKHECLVGISRDFNIKLYHKIDGESLQSDSGLPCTNQVEIVKNLIKWGFVK